MLCAIGAGISGTIAWALVNHFWPGTTLEVHKSAISVVLQSGSLSTFIGNVIALTFMGVFIAFAASLFAAPIAFLLLPPVYVIFRRIGLAHPAFIAVIGAAAGTLFFWAVVASTVPFYGYVGHEKLAVAALIGGAGGFADALLFANSMRSGK